MFDQDIRDKIFENLKHPIKNDLFDSLSKLSVKINSIANISHNIFEQYNNQLKRATAPIKALERINSPLWEINEKYSRLFDSIKNQWSEIIERINVAYPENLKRLAKYGWYFELDGEKTLAHIIAKDFQDGYVDIAEELAVNYYEENLERIFAVLYHRHSERKTIISEIKQSYDSKLFSTGITCLLSQIDGICFDKVSQLFFIRDKKNYLPNMIKPLTELQDDFLDMFICPLLELCPIFVGEDKLDDFPCKLNRHRILHGKDLEFGQKENFLKCLSLLKYTSDLLSLMDNDHQTIIQN